MPDHRLCIAPMLDWTDRYCRYFLRQISRHVVLYSEMVTTGALLHRDPARFGEAQWQRRSDDRDAGDRVGRTTH